MKCWTAVLFRRCCRKRADFGGTLHNICKMPQWSGNLYFWDVRTIQKTVLRQRKVQIFKMYQKVRCVQKTAVFAIPTFQIICLAQLLEFSFSKASYKYKQTQSCYALIVLQRLSLLFRASLEKAQVLRKLNFWRTCYCRTQKTLVYSKNVFDITKC